MGAGAFHGRVRKGNGCSHPAITTRSAKRNFRLNLADLARFEKLVRLEVSFVLFEHVVGCVSGRSPQAQSASPEVWRAVRSIGSKTRTCVSAELKPHRTTARTLCVRREMSTGNGNDQANRAISTGKLHALPHFHTRPINVVVFHGSDREHSFPGWFPA